MNRIARFGDQLGTMPRPRLPSPGSVLALLPPLLAITAAPTSGAPIAMRLRDCAKHTTIDTILEIELGARGSASSPGSLPGVAPLPIPATHSSRAPLQPDGLPSTYPARAAVRLDYPRRDAPDMLEHGCSGTLISPSMVLTAAHCVLSDRQVLVNPDALPWHDTVYARPGFDRGEDIPGMAPTRVSRSWVPHSYMETSGHPNYSFDWAILQLEAPIGLQAGWIQPAPGAAGDSVGPAHALSYPGYPSCAISYFTPPYSSIDLSPDCDTVQRSDTLFHTVFHPRYDSGAWRPGVWFGNANPAWHGESGSGILFCENSRCQVKGLRVWSSHFLALDSLSSGAVAEVLRQDPAGLAQPAVRPAALRLILRTGSSSLRIASPRPGTLRIADPTGRVVHEDHTLRREWTIPSSVIGGGIRIVLVQGEGMLLRERIALP